VPDVETLPTAGRVPFRIPLVAAAASALSLNDKLESIAAPLRQLDEVQVRTRFALLAGDQLVKTTISLCPDCVAHLPAAVFVRDGAVWMHKQCGVHGPSAAVIENDARWYRVSDKDRWGRAYGGFARLDIPAFQGSCCGPGEFCADSRTPPASPQNHTDQSTNKTCTVLVEITDACNLACRVCYSDSKGDRILPLETFKRHLSDLLVVKGRLDSVQITGGEASLHPQFHEIVSWLCDQPAVGKVYLPTNGLLLAKPGFIDRLKPHRNKLLVLLQFDGRDEDVNQQLRAAKPERIRERVIRMLDRAGIAMQLTMTLSPGVSEGDIAWVVRQGLAHKNVRLVAMQPAFFSGRYELEASAAKRLTLSDCVKGVVQGLGGRARHDDFLPIPCSHPNCGWVTLFARRFGIVRNIARHVDLNAVMNEVAYKTLLSQREMQSVVGTRGSWLVRASARVARKLVRPQDVFGIAIKPFMDRFSYDQDRVSSCCHHILDTQGNAVSFCEYNARLRAQDSWQARPQIDVETVGR
jgi:7,8-dihydro-6-hydroxymethylpterin dimethyltransferase